MNPSYPPKTRKIRFVKANLKQQQPFWLFLFIGATLINACLMVAASGSLYYGFVMGVVPLVLGAYAIWVFRRLLPKFGPEFTIEIQDLEPAAPPVEPPKPEKKSEHKEEEQESPAAEASHWVDMPYPDPDEELFGDEAGEKEKSK